MTLSCPNSHIHFPIYPLLFIGCMTIVYLIIWVPWHKQVGQHQIRDAGKRTAFMYYTNRLLLAITLIHIARLCLERN